LGVLISLQSLLDDPNCDSPANSEAAALYTKNRNRYDELVNVCVRDSWVFDENWLHILPFGLEKADETAAAPGLADARAEAKEVLDSVKKRRVGA
jgi:hypothetical protein